MTKTTYFAVIDLGSNSARLKVFLIEENGDYQIVREERQMVRLSEGMGAEKQLRKGPIKRTIAALKDFQEILKEYEDCPLRAVATAAVRNATNQKEFLAEVSEKVGLELEVITGQQEAYFDYIGVSRTLTFPNYIMIDTGGGSTELVLVMNNKAIQLISLPWGAVNLSEQFFTHDRAAADELFSLITFVEKLFHEVWWLKNGYGLPVIALGGSNRTLAKIERRKDKQLNYEEMHGFAMAGTEIQAIYKDILSKDTKERGDIPGLSRDRADIIAAGLMPLVQLMTYVDSQQVIFSKHGLREGFFFDYYEEQFKQKGKNTQ